MKEATYDGVRQTAADVFGVPENQLAEHSSPEDIMAWDSLQHLNFIVALEARFNVQFSPEEMEQIRNLGDASRSIDRKLPG